MRELGTLHGHAGQSRRNRSQGLESGSASDFRQADPITLLRRRCLPIHAGGTACRPRMNVPADGIIAAGPGSLMKTGGEGRTQGPGSFAGATADKHRRSAPLENANGCEGTACPPDSGAHALRKHPCRDAGNRTMSVPGARYQRYQGEERISGGTKGRRSSDLRGRSTSCAVLRAARSRSLRVWITRDNCCYRAQYCQ